MGTAKVRAGCFFAGLGVLTEAGLGADGHAPVSPKSPRHPNGGLFRPAPAVGTSVTVPGIPIPDEDPSRHLAVM